MFSVDKHTVMQIAMVEVMPPDKSLFEVTRVLTDTRSSKTSVTEEILKD